METNLPFTVFNKIDLKDFRKFLIINYLQQYSFIFPGIVGIFLLYLGIKNGFEIHDNNVISENYQFFLGIVLLINTIYQISKESKKLTQIPYLKSGEIFRFEEEGLFIESEFRKLFYPWNAIFGYSETKDFLILHANTIHGVYLAKNDYTPEQLSFLKNKVGIPLNKKNQ